VKSNLFFYFSPLFVTLCICTVARGELVHRYSFTNGDVVAVDSVGGQNGTLVNGASISGNAVQLDGDDDYVNLPPDLITGFTSVTFEAWFNHTANGTWTRVFDFGDINGSAGRYYIFFTPDGGSSQARFVISDADPGNNHEEIAYTSTIDFGVPVYVACVYDGVADTMSLYVDGQLEDSISVSIPLSSVDNVFSYLGRSLYSPDPYLAGSIDEFRIYDSALTSEEVSQDYCDGPDVISPVLVHRYSFKDGDTEAVDSVGDANGTLVNGASISGNAVQLDGDNDYVNLPGGLITGFTSVTIEAWFEVDVQQTWQRVFDFGDTNPSGNGRYYIFFTTQAGDMTSRLAISDADPGFDYEEIAFGPAIDNDVPVYIACVYDGCNDTMNLYVDGMLMDSIPVSIDLSVVDNVYSYLGRSLYNTDPYLEGSIDEFRIYSSALTPGQIAEHYIDGPDLIGESLLVIEESGGSTEVIEGDDIGDEYTIALVLQPDYSVTVTVDPDEQLDVGNGRGNPIEIVIEPEDWDSPQTVTVTAYDDDVLEEEPHLGIISHSISSADPDFDDKPLPVVNVSIFDNECGAWGFLYSDLNFDCIVNFKDHAIFALYWLTTLEPVSLETIVEEWLKTTQPYAAGAEHGPVMDSPNPLLIEPDEVVGEIDEKVYGHFLEHIYHSVNGGLWGELVWNRSFELSGGGGANWSIEGDELVQSGLGTDIHMEFGDTAWDDYELTLEAKKDSGSEGFLILFRAPNSDNFYWLNLGGWANTLHAIEKEVNGGRTVVTSQISGSINTGLWYEIRIQCEGNNFQVWLDDSQLFDYTDTSSPHMTGEIGVGTWATAARFRNIVVEDLEGEELWSGLPDIEDGEVIADYWESYGTGSFSLDDTDALNSDFCLQIDNDDGTETGIKQTPFNITTQLYTGSIWARGAAPGGMVVRILDGESVLAEQTLPSPTGSWDEYPFSFTPISSAQDATLQVGVSGVGTAYLDQISMMGQDSIDTGGYRPDLLQAIDDLHPPCIRWPGGCFASLYLWQDGIGPQSERKKYPAYMWDDQDINAYGTDEHLRMCEILGIEPIIVINTGWTDSACGGTAQWKLPDPCDYLPYALDWMEYCNGDANTTEWGAKRRDNGHPAPYNVTYWEIDNETWWMGSSNYCDVVNLFAPAMRLKAAELGVPIKIIACGSSGYDTSWNEDIIDGCAEKIDYISVHYYEGDDYASRPFDYEDYLINLGNYIADSDNPDMKIDNSEWNFQTTDWRTGLFAGGILNVYERTSDFFEIGGPALFLRHQSASGWDNAFINFDHTGWFPAPNYVVMKLWHDNYAPYRINMTGNTGSLNAVATLSDDGSEIYFKVVNPTAEEIPVKLIISEDFDTASASMQLVAPGSLYARNTLEDPNVVQPQEVFVSLNGQIVRFTMPELSAAVVKVSKE